MRRVKTDKKNPKKTKKRMWGFFLKQKAGR